MKYIKILFRDKSFKPLYLSIEKWESIINDSKTLVAYKLDNETEWTGRVLNKSEVIWSEYDEDYTKKMNEQKFFLYRNIETNTIIKMLEGELPDDITKYEKLSV